MVFSICRIYYWKVFTVIVYILSTYSTYMMCHICNFTYDITEIVQLIWISAEPKGKDLVKNVTNNICPDCPKKVLDKISLLHLV